MTTGKGAGAGHRSAVSELVTRSLAAFVLVPVALAAVWLGGWYFAALCLAAAVIVTAEWWRLCGHAASIAELVIAALFYAGICYFLLQYEASTALVVLGSLIAAAAISGAWAGGPFWRAAGVFYAGFPLFALLVIRNDAAFGLVAVIWLLVVVWATDIAAYAAGRLIGGPKIWPRVSPNKTWAGLGGGVAAAAIAGVVTAGLLDEGSAGTLTFLSASLAVVAQAGDFMESALKRRFGKKDAGALIPGHGGLMDRVDGLLAVAAVAGLLGVARGGWDLAARGLLIW
jgi:phosphatidate cytidylyltransferase